MRTAQDVEGHGNPSFDYYSRPGNTVRLISISCSTLSISLFPLASLVCSGHLKTRSLQRTRTYPIAITSWLTAPLPYLPCLSLCLILSTLIPILLPHFFPPPTNSLPHKPNSKHANPTFPRRKKSYKSPAR